MTKELNVGQIMFREKILGLHELTVLKRDEVLEVLGTLTADVANGNVGHFKWRKSEREVDK